MSYQIYGKVEGKVLTTIGCVKGTDIPADSILLQEVHHHSEFNCVKWALRFRRTLKDKKLLGNPKTTYFTNSHKLTRMLGEKDFAKLSEKPNGRFLQFHRRNPHLLEELIRGALAKNDEGRDEYSLDQLLGEARWGETKIDRGTARVKIDATWSPWYSRVLQMVEPRLVGFFSVKTSIADGLIWIDGRAWQQFASEHADRIRWKERYEELPDSHWEYRG